MEINDDLLTKIASMDEASRGDTDPPRPRSILIAIAPDGTFASAMCGVRPDIGSGRIQDAEFISGGYPDTTSALEGLITAIAEHAAERADEADAAAVKAASIRDAIAAAATKDRP